MIELPDLGQRYLSNALQLDPEYEPALILQTKAQEIKALTPEAERQARWNAFDKLPYPTTPEEFDNLYMNVWTFAEEEVHWIWKLCMTFVMKSQMILISFQTL